MTALATSTDVETAIGRTLTAEETARAGSLLLLASAAVEDATGYRFTPGSYTVSRTARSGRVVLPGPVDSVDEVRSIDRCDGSAEVLTVVTDYTTRGRTVYGLTGLVEVDFTTVDAVPAEVVALVAGVVAGTLSAPPVGATQETTGPYSVSYISSSGRVFLSASDKAVLRRYVQPKPALDVLR